MRCVYCGFVMGEEATICSNCGKPKSTISVLSPDEREAFDGITIDQESGDRARSSGKQEREKVYFRHVYVGGGNRTLSGLMTLLAVGLVIAVILFFAVPIIVMGIGAAIAIWLLRRLFF